MTLMSLDEPEVEDTMKFYRNLIKETRVLVIASASGIALFSQQLPIQALELPFSHSRSAAHRQNEPARLQISNTQIRSMQSVSSGPAVQTQYQEPASAKNRAQQLYSGQPQAAPQAMPTVVTPPQALPQPNQPPLQSSQNVSPVAGTQETRRSLLDRLVGKVRGGSSARIPSGPPQDPGMRYTTVTEAARQQELAKQQMKRSTPPPVPAAIAPAPAAAPRAIVKGEQSVAPMAPPAMGSGSAPRLFPPTKTAAPLDSAGAGEQATAAKPANPPAAFVPPMPGSDEFLAPSADSGKALASTEKRESFPELKAMMQGPTAESAKQATAADPGTLAPLSKEEADELIAKRMKPLPILDLNNPLPQLEHVLENEKDAASDAMETVDVAEEKSPVPPPAPAAIAPQIVQDPLANAFPDDAPKPMPEVNRSSEQELEETSQIASLDSKPMPAPSAGLAPEATLEIEEEVPYNGLTLESDLFVKAKTPAPGEPTNTAIPKSPHELQQPAVRNQIVKQAPQPEAKTNPPELPLLPLPRADELSTKMDDATAAKDEEQLTPSKELPQLQAPQVDAKVAETAESEPGQVHLAPQRRTDVKQTKMELIASRRGMTGLKGFCPVMLRDARDLVDASDEFTALFDDNIYTFSSEEALEAFLNDPEKYAPARHGNDVIHFSLTGEEVEGSLDFAVWYKGRLYLFTSAETMETFVAAPSSHATNL